MYLYLEWPHNSMIFMVFLKYAFRRGTHLGTHEKRAVVTRHENIIRLVHPRGAGADRRQRREVGRVLVALVQVVAPRREIGAIGYCVTLGFGNSYRNPALVWIDRQRQG